MNPQDYNTQGENQPNSQSVKSWFDNIDTPPGTTLPQPNPETPKRSKTRLIIVSSCIILLVGLATSAILYGQSASSIKCLNAQNYKELLGIESEDKIDAKTNFYATTIAFDADSTDYNEFTQKESEDLINSIGSLYKNHHKDTSINISLSNDYVFEAAAATAAERLEKIKSSLIDAGVKTSAITIVDPQLITQEEDSETDDLPTQIRINSSQDCRE